MCGTPAQNCPQAISTISGRWNNSSNITATFWEGPANSRLVYHSFISHEISNNLVSSRNGIFREPWPHDLGKSRLGPISTFLKLCMLMALSPQIQPPTSLDQTSLLEQVNRHGLNIDVFTNPLIIDRLLSIEMAKALDTFQTLELEDQVGYVRGICFQRIGFILQLLMIRHIIVPINIFFNSFYSAMAGADTWIRPDGLMPMTVLTETERFQHDKRLMKSEGSGDRTDARFFEISQSQDSRKISCHFLNSRRSRLVIFKNFS